MSDSDLFLDDYEYNNYFDEETKTAKEELDNVRQLGDEEKCYRVPSTPLSKDSHKQKKGLKC